MKTLFNYILDQQWKDVMSLLQTNPEHAKVWSKMSFGDVECRLLPLHAACCREPPVEVVDRLASVFPKALTSGDSVSRRLPIHLACLKSAQLDVVEALLAARPETAKTTSRHGRTPLHYACGGGASVDVVAALLKRFPEGAARRDANGWTPLHTACVQGARATVCAALLDAHPDAVATRSENGNTPEECLRSVPDGENKRRIVSALRAVAARRDRRSHSSDHLDLLTPKEIGERCARAVFC